MIINFNSAESDADQISAENLLYVMALRSVVIFSLIAGLWIGKSKLGIGLPLEPILGAIGMFVLVNVFRMLRMSAVPQWELCVELVLDITALSAVLYFAGGISNPFVSFYLVLIAVGAMLLPGHYSWTIAALALACYSSLMFFYRPMIHRHDPSANGNPAFDLHIVGAGATFALSALIIAILLVRMTTSLRERERRLAAAREENLRNERIVALGAFAAGAAHELGTPLSTIAVIAKELERRSDESPQVQEMLQTLRTQVNLCKNYLTELTANAGADRMESCSLRAASDFLSETLSDWQAMRPDAKVEFVGPSLKPAPNIIAEPTLKQALISVLNNAADVSPRAIEVRADWNGGKFSVDILDRGPGLSDHDLARVGQTTFSTKPAQQGLGVGLYLARAALERFGGSLTISNRSGGGVHASVLIPTS
jgi:two-component system, sensor histidine kinase RegB